MQEREERESKKVNVAFIDLDKVFDWEIQMGTLHGKAVVERKDGRFVGNLYLDQRIRVKVKTGS